MSAKRKDFLALAGLALASVVFCRALLMLPLLVPAEGDVWNFLGYAAFDRLAIVHFGQFPFRSPYHGGGYPLFTYPDDFGLSPRLPLILAFGEWMGLKAGFILTVFLAAAGTYLFTRRRLVWPVPGAIVSAVCFAFSGFLPYHWHMGWFMKSQAAVFPWVLYFWSRSRRDVRYLIACGLVMGAMLLDAKYALAVLVWFMVLWMLLGMDRPGRQPRPRWQPFVVLGAVVVWGVLMASPKLLPLAPLLREHFLHGGQGRQVSVVSCLLWLVIGFALVAAPRLARLRPRRRAMAWTTGVVAVSVCAVVLLSPRNHSPTPEWFAALRLALQRIAVPEAAGLGGVGIVLAIAAAVFRWRRMWPWLVLTLLLLWIAAEESARVVLAKTVYSLPGLSVIRKPRRQFLVYLLFCLSVLAGRGAVLPVEWLRQRWARLLPWGLAAVACVYSLVVSSPGAWESPWAPLPPNRSRFPYHLIRELRGPYGSVVAIMRRNVGVIEWDLDLHDRRYVALRPRSARLGGPIDPAYRGEVYFWRPDSPNRAEMSRFTPLEIRVRVDVKQPGLLCINQIKDDDWRTSEGAISTRSNTLGVELTRIGAYEVRLRYVPVLFYWGAGISLVSLLGGVALILLIARRRRRAGLSPPDTG